MPLTQVFSFHSLLEDNGLVMINRFLVTVISLA